MLSRKSLSSIVAGATMTQMRHNHERWYGHIVDLDSHAYKFTADAPPWMKKPLKGEDETNFTKSLIPHIDFYSSYETLLRDADRLNVQLNRKEFANEVKHRLEKQANTVARSQQLIKDNQHKGDTRMEDMMIARIADEEHVQAEMKYVKCIRANELAEDNRLDILPGGSANSLREKTRWNVNIDLHPHDRSEIGARLTAWLPEKYHIVYVDDFQTVAANDEKSRKEMLAIVDGVKKEYEAEAKAGGFEEDLKETVDQLYEDVDPSREITAAAIKKCTSLDQLDEWSRVVHEYNGDSRILDIYERAAELTKNADHKKLVANMREWMKNSTKVPFPQHA